MAEAAAAAAGAMGLSGGQMACTMLFGTMILTYLGLEASRLRVLLRDGVDPSLRATASKHSEPLSLSFPSLYAFFRDSAALGLILLLAFMCEKFPLYPQGGKEWDRDMYWFVCLLLLVASLMTMRKGKSTDILNRDQTEEWKGWMQFMFLMYHYYHAEEVYNAIRIMITCYVWMTGFGNFSFFYIKQDFGFVRFVQMLWRLNLLVVLLCLSQGNTYILYYICPLHTFYFLLVYATMRVAPHRNHGKWDVRLKLLAVALLIYLVWDLFGGRLFALLFGTVLGDEPVIGAKSGALWEWYFRTSLDHWSTLLGMVFALNFPLATRWLARVEELPLGRQAAVKGAVGLGVGGAFAWWATAIFPQGKLAYNLTNAYYGFVPLLAYIYFRNLTPSLRSWHSGLLHDIGKVTLETYLLQHHVWLTSNAKTLLVLLPGYPKCNLVVTTVLFVWLSRQIFYITMSLRGMVLPDDRRRCLAGALATAGTLAAAYGLGWLLAAVGLGFATAALLACGAAALVLGVVHRRLNLNLWGQVRSLGGMGMGGGPSGSGGLTALRAPSSPDSLGSLGRIAGTLLALGFLLSLPFRPQQQPLAPAVASASGSQKPHTNLAVTTPPAASASSLCLGKALTEGSWVCPKEGGAGSCASPSEEVWRWADSGSSKACGFHDMDAAELRALYGGKEVAIVGDSLGRKYYFGLLEALGHPDPLAHDAAAAKHQDLRFETTGKTEKTGTEGGSGKESLSVAFYWRPYAKEVQAQLAQWAASGPVAARPDALLLSFGLWDTLHETPAAEVEGALGGIAEALAQGEKAEPGGAFRAWLLPTAIVDGKLLTEEKRAHMTEAQVAAARKQARASALDPAVDVVLDGAAVTQGLAGRSEDGVHYDDGVYTALVQMGSNAYAGFLQQQKGAGASGGGGKKQKQKQRRRLVRSLDDVADWEEWVVVVDSEGEGKGEGAGVGSGVGTHRVLKAAGSEGGAGKPKEIDGSMSSPAHGAFMLVVIALMLLTMDSYAGFSWLGLCLARVDTGLVTWEEAYEPLLSKILRTSLPSSSSGSSSSGAHGPGSVGGGGGGSTGTTGGSGVVGGVGGSSGHHHSHSGVGGAGAAVRGRYTPVPQGEIELGGVDQPLSPGESGPTPNEE